MKATHHPITAADPAPRGTPTDCALLYAVRTALLCAIVLGALAIVILGAIR